MTKSTSATRCRVTLPSGVRIRIWATNLAYVSGHTSLVVDYGSQ